MLWNRESIFARAQSEGKTISSRVKTIWNRFALSRFRSPRFWTSHGAFCAQHKTRKIIFDDFSDFVRCFFFSSLFNAKKYVLRWDIKTQAHETSSCVCEGFGFGVPNAEQDKKSSWIIKRSHKRRDNEIAVVCLPACFFGRSHLRLCQKSHYLINCIYCMSPVHCAFLLNFLSRLAWVALNIILLKLQR